MKARQQQSAAYGGGSGKISNSNMAAAAAKRHGENAGGENGSGAYGIKYRKWQGGHGKSRKQQQIISSGSSGA